MKKCYLVGAGEFYGTLSPSDEDIVIAADGGYNHLISHGVRCDLLVGDLDSLGEAPDSVTLLRHPKKKDETDMHLAYLEGVRRGYTDFTVYGGTGGSEDHTFANYSLLLYAARVGHRMTLVGEYTDATVIKDGEISLFAERGKRLSVLAIGAIARGVSISGAEYSLDDGTLEPSFPLGVSNSFIGTEVKLSVTDGALLIFTER